MPRASTDAPRPEPMNYRRPMSMLTDDEAREIEEGVEYLRGPILLTWIRRLLVDRRARIDAMRTAQGKAPEPSERT